MSKLADLIHIDDSAADALRDEIFNKIKAILTDSDSIQDSVARMSIQTCCLDVVTDIEAIIDRYDLESQDALNW